MLKIRLRRVGKRHQPAYRVVVVEHTAPVQGSYLELVGTYNPRARQFAVNQDRVIHWLDRGAQPSERVAKLLTSTGVTHKLIVLPDFDRKPKRVSKKAPVEKAAPVAKVEEPAAATDEAPTVEETPSEVPAEQTAAETTETATEESAAVSTEEGSTPPEEAAVTEEEQPTV